jgi:hypothetical protein
VRRAEHQRQLRTGRAAELFAEGQPQPQVERDLRPGLELSISQMDGRTPPFDLLPAAKTTDPSPKVGVTFEGSARDTAFGRCVMGLADAKLLHAALPHPISPHRESRAWLFPPGLAPPASP